MITRMNKKNIVVTLSTGHGKSVIIQLLADILVALDGEVIIVGLNNFLSHWGRTNYGSFNVLNNKVTYMPLEHFIKRDPNKLINVIFDEVDQMLGVNSFNLIEKGTDVKAVYQASLMR